MEELKKLQTELQEATKAMRDLIDMSVEEKKKFGETQAQTAESFKKVNDKIDDIEKKMKDLVAQMTAPSSAKSEETNDKDSPEFKAAFKQYMRKGDKHLSYEQRAVLSSKALSSDVDPDGGFVVTEEMQSRLLTRKRDLTFIRQAATVISTSAGSVSIPSFDYEGDISWVGESKTIPTEPFAKMFGKTKFMPSKLARILKFPKELSQDAAFDIEGLVVNHFATRFVEIEENAFLNGDGIEKPLGLLIPSVVAKLNPLAATPAGPKAPIDEDDVVLLPYQLKAVYRGQGSYMTHRTGVRHIRTLKDGQGRYLWQPALTLGEPASLNGYALQESEFFPDNVTAGAAGSPMLLFGDWSTYWIVERTGVEAQRLVELYAEQDNIGYKLTQRVDGAPVDKNGFTVLTHA